MDRALVEQAMEGDGAAFDALVERVGDQLHWVLLRILRDPTWPRARRLGRAGAAPGCRVEPATRDGLGRPLRPSIRPASSQFGQAREESEIAEDR